VDAVLCSVQTSTQESQPSRSCSLRVRLGVVAAMVIVVEYYLLRTFRKQSEKWVPPEQRGRIIPFPLPEKVGAEVVSFGMGGGPRSWHIAIGPSSFSVQSLRSLETL
jgi:hypothetical protein